MVKSEIKGETEYEAKLKPAIKLGPKSAILSRSHFRTPNIAKQHP